MDYLPQSPWGWLWTIPLRSRRVRVVSRNVWVMWMHTRSIAILPPVLFSQFGAGFYKPAEASAASISRVICILLDT